MGCIYDLEEIAISKFPAIIRDLEEYGDFYEDRDKVLNMELYNLAERRDIVSAYSSEGLNFINCTKVIQPEFLAPYLKRIKEDGFFIEFANEKTKLVRLVIDYFKGNSINQNIEISLAAKGYKVEILYVTPLNYLELQEGEDVRLRLYRPLLFYKRLVYSAIESSSSDIHITNRIGEGDTCETYVYFRILNSYRRQSNFRINREFADKLIHDLVTEYALEQALDLGTPEGVKVSWLNPLYDNSCSLRITCSNSLAGYTAVCRISRMSVIGKCIEDLGFNYRMETTLKFLSTREEGITFITGAVRTGKNTTLVAMVNEAVDKEIKFMEYSAPVETIMPFEQADFKGNNESLLCYVDLAKKQDIDIVIISELPSKDLSKPVIDLVNSSIGVITTFHINRIWHFFYKLKNYFGEEYIDLITQVNGVVNQKMFIKQCPKCAHQHEVVERDFPPNIYKILMEYKIFTYYQSEGCLNCNYTGKLNEVQPFGEYIIFDDELKTRLLQCTEARFMEPIIKEYVIANESSLEFAIKEGIDMGVLHPLDFNKL